ncbi:GntR family transcriptional regulator [Antrihabitans sp. YC2-6]|nr:GntR family transcriptional regulator [Antrihabitans sp. YC2-6]
MSIVCPDILTFNHSVDVIAYTSFQRPTRGRRRSELTVNPTLDVEIDRSSPVPLYFQLAQVFESAILQGELRPGDRFENELALAKRLNLSRPTTRRAIQELVDKGLLVRKRGVGTQVVQSPVHRPVELTSLFDDLARAGQTPMTTVLDYHRGPPTEEIARELNISVDQDVVTIRRLRSSMGEPLAVMTNHLPAAWAPDRADLEDHGLYQLLRSKGVHIRLARQRIGAKAANREEAKLLDEKLRAPLLTMNRTAFDDSGRIVEYGSHVYRASRYYFDTTLINR